MEEEVKYQRRIFAVDPGREKHGLAVLSLEGCVLSQSVVDVGDLRSSIRQFLQDGEGEALVVGDRTGSDAVVQEIGEEIVGRFRKGIIFVDEHMSSVEGRRRYLHENRDRWYDAILPVGLRTPKRPYDDYVAVILGERYLKKV